MKKKIVIAVALLILFSTITSQKKIQIFSKFNLQEIQIENNLILKEGDLKKLLIPIYNKNLLFLSYTEIEKLLMQNSFIDGFNIKKKYPQSLRIEIFEKKPIAILIYNKEKYYLSEKIELIEFNDHKNFKELPYIFGNHKKFKQLYDKLKQINFPLKEIKNYTFYESNRWDLKTEDIVIKLPNNDYEKSLKEYLMIKDKKNFKKYKIFDFRVNNQLILK